MMKSKTHPWTSAARERCFGRMSSPVGPLLFVGKKRPPGLVLEGVYFERSAHAEGVLSGDVREDGAAFAEVRAQLRAYFAGERTTFELALAPEGTDFQVSVWRALAAIPYGETTTYAAIAQKIGRPRAVRAVGAANGRNPLSIVIPCHRVIKRNGALTGYAGGVPNKEHLLALEARRAGART